MISVELDSKDRKTSGTISIEGDYEAITNEIYLLLVTFAQECPGPFDDAVEKHLMDMMEDEK